MMNNVIINAGYVTRSAAAVITSDLIQLDTNWTFIINTDAD